MRLGWVVAASVWAAAFGSAAAAQSGGGAAKPGAGGEQTHVRGTIARLEGDTLEVETGPGRITKVRIPADAKVAAAEDAGPDAIAQGAFVGTAAVAQPDGTLRALEVHVFPESMRGAGEGHRPWDRGSKSSMTNGMVAGAKGATRRSSMTNGTVQEMTGAGGARTLTLTYAGGKQTVVVPNGVPIVKLEPGDRALLVPGAHVFAIATGDKAGLVAERLTVGKGATVPPM